MYRASYAARLPLVNIPLRMADRDVKLNLQALIDQAYEEAGYNDIDYSHHPVPPFLPEEQAWADDLLRKAGRR